MPEDYDRPFYDFYETRSGQVDALVRYFEAFAPINDRAHVFEPCVGKRAIIGRLQEGKKGASLLETTNDKDIRIPADHHYDMTNEAEVEAFFAKANRSSQSHRRYLITNPPFKDQNKIVPLLYNYFPGRFIAILLRLSFLEPTFARAEFLRAHPPLSILVFGSPRPGFHPDGKRGLSSTDSVTTAFFVWDKFANDQAHGHLAPRFVFCNDWKELGEKLS